MWSCNSVKAFCGAQRQSKCDRTLLQGRAQGSWEMNGEKSLGLLLSHITSLSCDWSSGAVQNWDRSRDLKCRYPASLIQRRPICFRRWSERGNTNMSQEDREPDWKGIITQKLSFVSFYHGWGPWLFKKSSFESVHTLELILGPRGLPCEVWTFTPPGQTLKAVPHVFTVNHAECTQLPIHIHPLPYTGGSYTDDICGLPWPSGFWLGLLMGSTSKRSEDEGN